VAATGAVTAAGGESGPGSGSGPISTELDVERIRREARILATRVGCDRYDAEAIVLAVSELATNLVRHAPGGAIVVSAISDGNAVGIAVDAHDAGPGIADVELALRDGFSTRGGLGSGLPAVRRLMDDFAITTSPDGTTIQACKWCRSRSA
jgi:serine/threonine-protein kinase RsbT